MKKGRHRRFEEARKLKQMGPDALLDLPDTTRRDDRGADEDDEYARIAERYGVDFDDDEDDDED